MPFRSSREKLLHRALALYAGEHVLSHVLEKGESALVPGQESREATIMFVDIASFSPPPGGIVPERFSEWQSAYLNIVTDAIISRSGTLDTFVGDGACAWWARTKLDNDVEQACHAAIDIASRVQKLNRLAIERSYPISAIKIGLHTGAAAIGPYGSKDRLKFGIIGDAVNFAFRLCQLSGTLSPAVIVLSEMTRSRLPSNLEVKALKAIEEKDRQQPVAIYTLKMQSLKLLG